jgi:hypothetical protein
MGLTILANDGMSRKTATATLVALPFLIVNRHSSAARAHRLILIVAGDLPVRPAKVAHLSSVCMALNCRRELDRYANSQNTCWLRHADEVSIACDRNPGLNLASTDLRHPKPKAEIEG